MNKIGLHDAVCHVLTAWDFAGRLRIRQLLLLGPPCDMILELRFSWLLWLTSKIQPAAGPHVDSTPFELHKWMFLVLQTYEMDPQPHSFGFPAVIGDLAKNPCVWTHQNQRFHIWLVAWNIFSFPIYWELRHPNSSQLTNIFQPDIFWRMNNP